jgi:hypothetical protein
VMWVMWNLASFCLEIVLVSVQDRCMCLHQMYHQLKPLWTESMVLLGDKAQVNGHFDPFGDSANLDARLVHGLC